MNENIEDQVIFITEEIAKEVKHEPGDIILQPVHHTIRYEDHQFPQLEIVKEENIIDDFEYGNYGSYLSHMEHDEDYTFSELEATEEDISEEFISDFNKPCDSVQVLSQVEQVVLDQNEFSQLEKPRKKIILRKHIDSKPYTCEKCWKKFARNRTLQAHLIKHENDKSIPYVCDICLKKFRSKNALLIHKQSHASHYVCKICFKSFTELTSLIQHKKIHEYEKVQNTYDTSIMMNVPQGKSLENVQMNSLFTFKRVLQKIC